MSEYIVDVGNADEEYIGHFGYMATAYADNPIRELIVRCRDCKHKFMDTPGHPYCGRLGEYSDFPTDDEMFCAWAERREP